MKRTIEKVIGKLRKQPDYRIKGDYSAFEMFMILYYRFFQLFRGYKLKIFAKKTKGLVFCGKDVRIEHPYLFRAGENLIIEDNVKVNALSINGIQLGRNVNIGKNAIIICSGVIANKGIGLKVGNSSAIGAQGFIGAQGGVEIGNDVIFGPGVRVFSENHNFKSIEAPIRLQGETRSSVKIGNNCWVGAGVTILGGVEIGEGCVIAAGSIVIKDVPKDTVYFNKITAILKSRIDEDSNIRN